MIDQKNGKPLLLRADNFTPPSRTPWGGARIRALKSRWVPREGPNVGESWEISFDPAFPSRVEESGELLADRVAPSALLVKLLDAADELSVQIHPRDDYESLREDESGKPEAWYIAARDPGAGIYLGLAEGIDRAAMERAIDGSEDVSKLLSFVPVEPGDFFLIEAGTPHCIARGVMLVEPQRVRPGCAGVTYRYWDWGRRYDAEGRLDPNGAPRALHRDHALAVTEWDRPLALDRVRVRAGARSAEARIDPLCGLNAPIASPSLRVARISGTGTIDLPRADELQGLTVLEGRVRIDAIEIEAGRSAVIPRGRSARADLDGAHAILSSAI